MNHYIIKTICLILILALFVSLLPTVALTASAAYDNYAGGMRGDGRGILAKGVDLSDWQGSEVDFEAIKGAGYDYVILRAGFAQTADKTFEGNYGRAKAAGLDVGVYLYSYASTKEAVLLEAAALKGWLKGKTLEYPVYFDLEDPETHGPMTKDALTELALAFLDDVAADGWLVGLYSCKSWLDYKMDTEKICKKYECWMAQYLADGTYSVYDRYDEVYGMWQYSSSGSVPGVPGGTDMDVCFKDYPSICREYGFNGYEATGEILSLSGASAPDVIPYGENYSVTGKVTTRAGQLTNVTVGFFDETGNMAVGKSVGPKDTSYDLSKLAAEIKTKDLAEGRYFYRVIATNTAGTKTLLDHEVVVSKSGARLDSCKAPEDLKEGTRYSVNGMITATTEITGVTVQIDGADGKNVQKVNASPKTTDYDLSALADKISVASLKPGSYRYTISVQTGKGSQALLTCDFRVWVKEDPVTVSDLSLRQEYYTGSVPTITGTVTSRDSALDSVTIEILDRNDEIVCSGEVEDLDRTADLAEAELALSELSAGSYYYVIRVCNAAGPAIAERKRFIIRNDAISLCGLQAPELLIEGDAFGLRGVVVSEDSALRYVSVSVLDQNDFPLLSAADVPAGASYDLRELSDYLLFSKLQKGTYTLRISAENEHFTTELLHTEFSVVRTRYGIHWASEHVSPDAVSYSAVNSLGLFGVLESDELPIDLVSLQILNSDAQTVSSAYIYPDENKLDISYLNQYVHLSAMPADEYRMEIVASNAAGSFVMLNAPFSLSDCPHVNVVSGKTVAATCTCAGAVSDSYCLDCGSKVRSGVLLPRIAHDYLTTRCALCGKVEPLTVNAVQTPWEPTRNSRIVIAYQQGEKWYALDAEGTCISITKPDSSGMISVSAELLWEPIIDHSGTVTLRSAQGRFLRLNDNGTLLVCSGREHSVLQISSDGLTSSIFCGEKYLSCAVDHFCAEAAQSPLRLFRYLP
ncbi:MAG: hypothetical protein IJG45_01995 [Oscillospiraceae bacterium]|nr:hypothetical protein [Oscillospiraceae bacterium]